MWGQDWERRGASSLVPLVGGGATRTKDRQRRGRYHSRATLRKRSELRVSLGGRSISPLESRQAPSRPARGPAGPPELAGGARLPKPSRGGMAKLVAPTPPALCHERIRKTMAIHDCETCHCTDRTVPLTTLVERYLLRVDWATMHATRRHLMASERRVQEALEQLVASGRLVVSATVPPRYRLAPPVQREYLQRIRSDARELVKAQRERNSSVTANTAAQRLPWPRDLAQAAIEGLLADGEIVTMSRGRLTMPREQEQT